MKVCKFCGAEVDDRSAVCPSCGGKEFKHRCGNCGTIFDSGNYCPRCGVKAGARAKICPNCGTEYYSNACPDCGYIRNSGNIGNTTVVYTSAAPQPVKKRRTWLWVLGWLFIFPIPLTILTLRSQKLAGWVKAIIIAAAWIVFIIIGFSGDGAESGNVDIPISAEESVRISADYAFCHTGIGHYGLYGR